MNNWILGDRYKTQFNHVFEVTEVLDGGMAMLRMIDPPQSRSYKQLKKPDLWMKIIPAN